MANEERVARTEELLRRVATSITHRGREHLGDFNITPPQFSALMVLVKEGEITMGDLCQKLYLACSTVTDLVDRMEKNGFVERFKDARDRRVIRLRVLPAGFAVHQDVITTRRSYLSTLLADLKEEEQELLVDSLQQLYDLMQGK